MEPSGTLPGASRAGTDALSSSPPENEGKTQPGSLPAWPYSRSPAPVRVPPRLSRVCWDLLFFPNLGSLMESGGCHQKQRRLCGGGAGPLPAAPGASSRSTSTGTETRCLIICLFIIFFFSISYILQ